MHTVHADTTCTCIQHINVGVAQTRLNKMLACVILHAEHIVIMNTEQWVLPTTSLVPRLLVGHPPRTWVWSYLYHPLFGSQPQQHCNYQSFHVFLPGKDMGHCRLRKIHVHFYSILSQGRWCHLHLWCHKTKNVYKYRDCLDECSGSTWEVG